MAVEPLRGLSEEQAAQRLLHDGANELPRASRRGLLRIAAETMREPMFILLMVAAVLYLVLGDLGEGLFILAGALATIGLVILQEARSERAMAALRDLAQPFARVIRGGAERRIPARELVVGDILLVGEGERLPADGLLVAGDMLSVDESALTGESAPVSKRWAEAGEKINGEAAPGAELGPHLFAGALVVRGQGVARVTRTGVDTALGRIGASLAAIGQEPTPLQRKAGRLVGLLGVLALAYCVLVAVAYGLIREDWVGGVLAGVTAAIALVPEEFPMVLAVFLAVGAWRLATHRVLVRRSAVIETLGGATVLCVDKTGTLTENRMEVARLWTRAGDVATRGAEALPDETLRLLRLAALASAVRPVDPMDRAIRERLRLSTSEPDLEAAEPERCWPLRPDRMAVIQAWRKNGAVRVAAAKGAPEAIFRLCRLPDPELARLHTVVDDFARQGLRVLGVASAQVEGAFPDDPHSAEFQFAGLVGFLDPVRADVPGALREAHAAGIAVVMITGDHPATARAIAETAGIDTSAGVLTGREVAAMSTPALRERLRTVRVFARMIPEQKLRLVEALKANGEVVAMTGDGVNDAPALEAAHIGVAMGKRGTDVAREAADLVLLDDSFVAIVGGVRLGRRIFINLRKALTYVTAIHVPIAGLALGPIVLGMPPLLFPMHVVLLELVIDPMCALVFEGEPSDADAMTRPPRRPDEALFGPAQLGLALAQGGGVLLGVFGVYAWALEAHSEPQARGAALVALVGGNLVLALADTVSVGGRLLATHRWAYWSIVTGASSVLALVLTVPALAKVFSMALPDARLLTLALLVAVVSGGWLGLALRLRPRNPSGHAGTRSTRQSSMTRTRTRRPGGVV